MRRFPSALSKVAQSSVVPKRAFSFARSGSALCASSNISHQKALSNCANPLFQASIRHFHERNRSKMPPLLQLVSFPQPRWDNTSDLTVSAPKGYREDKKRAAMEGANYFFTDLYSNSCLCVTFNADSRPNWSVEDYIISNKVMFLSNFAKATVSRVKLDDELTKHLSDSGVTVGAYLLMNGPNTSLNIVIKTPGGFWECSWLSHVSLIMGQKDSLLADFLKKLQVRLSTPFAQKIEQLRGYKAPTH